MSWDEPEELGEPAITCYYAGVREAGENGWVYERAAAGARAASSTPCSAELKPGSPVTRRPASPRRACRASFSRASSCGRFIPAHGPVLGAPGAAAINGGRGWGGPLPLRRMRRKVTKGHTNWRQK